MSFRKIPTYLGWFWVGFWGLMSWGAIAASSISGWIGCVLCAAIFFPVAWRYTKKYGWVKNLLGRIITFFVGLLLIATVRNPAPVAKVPVPATSPASSAPITQVSPAPSPFVVKPSPSPLPSPSPVVNLTPEPETTSQPPVEPVLVEEVPTPVAEAKIDPTTPVRDSISGSCECPYDTDSRGRTCGARSAYSKPGGSAPICYAGDRQ